MNKLQSKLKELNQMLVDDGYNGSNIVIQTLEEIREETINYTRCCKSDSEQLKDKKIKDLLNWVKSDLAQETNNKISKTATPYRTDKIKFLNKLLELENL